MAQWPIKNRALPASRFSVQQAGSSSLMSIRAVCFGRDGCVDAAGLLDRLRCIEDHVFAETGPDDLHPHGQAVDHTGWYGDRRQAQEGCGEQPYMRSVESIDAGVALGINAIGQRWFHRHRAQTSGEACMNNCHRRSSVARAAPSRIRLAVSSIGVRAIINSNARLAQ